MKSMKTLLAASIAAAAISAPAMAEEESGIAVDASVAIASTYLWRGQDLGSGTPAVSGDLMVSTAGFYTGVWASSGDTSGGTEYDLFVGYGTEVGGVSIDVSLWNYVYPTGAGYTGDADGTDVGELTELVVGVGYGAASFTAYTNVAGNSNYAYYTLGYDIGKFGFLLGMYDSAAEAAIDSGNGYDKPTHLDISYAYNDNLSFTVSQFISDEPSGDDAKVVVSYSIPLM